MALQTKRVLMMSNTYHPLVGGLEESIQRFTETLRSKGHDVVIVAPAFENQPEGEKDVIRLPALQKFNGTDFSVNIPVPGDLHARVKKFDPDLIHTHHPFLVGDLGLRLSRQYGIPIVFTYHTKYEDYVHYLPVRNEKVRRFLIQLAAGYANLMNHVITPSPSIREILLERDVKTPISVLSTGVPLKKFHPGDASAFRSEHGMKDTDFVVGHVGRLADEKNLDFLIEVARRYLSDQKNAHFLVAGGGPSREKMEHALSGDGLESRVHFLGVMKGEALIGAYRAMDVFAFSSRTETQGMVLLEAMACGVPVVAVDATGVRDVVEDQKNGRLLKSEDVPSFIEALEWIRSRRNDQALKSGLEETARQNSMSTCADQLLDIYTGVLSHHAVSEKDESVWRSVMNRIRAEWDLLKNLKNAGENALSKDQDKSE